MNSAATELSDTARFLRSLERADAMQPPWSPGHRRHVEKMARDKAKGA